MKQFYFEILDRFINEFDRRFKSNMKLFQCLDVFDINLSSFLDIEKIEFFASLYYDSVDVAILSSQITSAKSYFQLKSKEYNNVFDFYDELVKVSSGYTELLKLCQIYFTIPVSTASNERYFSVLKHGIFPPKKELLLMTSLDLCLFQASKEKLSSVGLPLSNCIGYGSDGAANVIGAHNSVWSRVKEEFKDCIQIKCSCHSLHLIVQDAFEVLPSNIGFLLAEIPAFFSRSTIRREDVLKIFETMNPNNERMG
ncbi:hypothetical protein Btru_057581 [Bulinus truncatus]|nr:hypothetical protein Btru_057581 [Bulinus truncatus]